MIFLCQISVYARLQSCQYILYTVAAYLSASRVEVSATAELLKHELNVHTAVRSGGYHDLAIGLKQYERRGDTAHGKHFVSRFGCGHTVGGTRRRKRGAVIGIDSRRRAASHRYRNAGAVYAYLGAEL